MSLRSGRHRERSSADRSGTHDGSRSRLSWPELQPDRCQPWFCGCHDPGDEYREEHHDSMQSRSCRCAGSSLAELKRLQGRTLGYLRWRAREVAHQQRRANWITRLGSRSARMMAIDEEEAQGLPGMRTARRPLPRGLPLPGRLLRVLRRQGQAPSTLRRQGLGPRGARRAGVLAGASRLGARMG
jgi:hypothetical protein